MERHHYLVQYESESKHRCWKRFVLYIYLWKNKSFIPNHFQDRSVRTKHNAPPRHTHLKWISNIFKISWFVKTWPLSLNVWSLKNYDVLVWSVHILFCALIEIFIQKRWFWIILRLSKTFIRSLLSFQIHLIATWESFIKTDLKASQLVCTLTKCQS